jgi:hypothetical protein
LHSSARIKIDGAHEATRDVSIAVRINGDGIAKITPTRARRRDRLPIAARSELQNKNVIVASARADGRAGTRIKIGASLKSA